MLQVNEVVTQEAYHKAYQTLKASIPAGAWALDTGEGGWGPNMTSKSAYLACLVPLLEKMELFSPLGTRPIFLDLGSGLGLPLVRAAQLGWLAVGVEAHEVCFRTSQDNLTRAFLTHEFDLTRLPRLLFGSFFPADFEVRRFVHEGERDARAAQGLHLEIERSAERVNYADAGIELNHVDLFYHFQWENLDNLLRLFSRYAKEGAIFCLCGDGREDDYTRVPDNIRYLPAEIGQIANFHYYQCVSALR